jgi:hypothetical protein
LDDGRGKASFIARPQRACWVKRYYSPAASWLAVLTHSFAQAARFGLYWFVFAEVIKVMLAAGVSTGWQRVRKEQA